MKSVAGKIKGELAQYRELAAFAQFASDLDKVTLAQLSRGQRLMEIMKQPQYSPLSVGQQVMVIYMGTQGMLDDVEVKDVLRFKNEFLAYAKNNLGAMLDEISTKGQFTDDQKKQIDEAVKTFKSTLFTAKK
ncbi:ATP synthase subunit alpha [compost metagenome]